MIYTVMTKKAMNVAFEAHQGQLDKCGVPYILHPVHLAEQMPDETTTIAALLHDVVEDTDVTFEQLAEHGFSSDIMDALVLLTHDESVEYMDYVTALKDNPIARVVKIADLCHNRDNTRMTGVNYDESWLKAQKIKYSNALSILGRDIVFATKNNGKMNEIRRILADIAYNVFSMDDLGITVDVIEDGKTFEENSVKKAVEISEVSGKITLADDSGIEIDFLNKAPGVYSSRFMGKDTSYEVKNARILEIMKDVPWEMRTARYVCAISAHFPDTGKTITETATLEGYIAYEIKGSGGFGYDPIFYVPELSMNLAETSADQKNKISHRYKALEKIKYDFGGYNYV